MRASKVSAEEQYRLVLECRASGLTDCQWCLEHGIKPGTFYNWIKRLRNNPEISLPAAHRRQTAHVKQEVVKVEFSESLQEGAETGAIRCADASAPCTSMELAIGGMQLRVPNGTDPQLLLCMIRALKVASC